MLVNTISNFELAFLIAGGGSQTLVVALYYNVFAGGVRPVYSIDAMAVIYMCMVHGGAAGRVAVRASDADGVQARRQAQLTRSRPLK